MGHRAFVALLLLSGAARADWVCLDPDGNQVGDPQPTRSAAVSICRAAGATPGSGYSVVEVTDPPPPPPPPPPAQCADGVDNDGDGLIDLADPGCVDAADDDESDDPPPPPPPPSDGICQVSWVNPTHNVDGTLYDDPAGTRLYRSDVAGGPYAMVLELNDPVADIADLTLSEGAHYIVATAFDVLGNESGNSNEALCDVVGGQTTVPQAPTILVQ